MMHPRRSLLFAALLISTVFLTACGKHGEEKKSASQVAARVNSEEITVYQINSVLSKMGNLDQASLPQVKHTVLDKLVDQELAVQAATESKLDRTPEVVQAIESARRDILTRAYFAKLVSGLSKPTTTEINKYFDDHPELFSQRRIYNLQQIVVSGDASLLQKAKDQIASGKSMQEIADWLKASNAKFSAEGGTRAADQIPLEVLSKLKEVKDGQSVIVEGQNSFLIAHVVSTQSQPMTQSDAIPRIQQFLNNQRANDVVMNELKRLKQEAKIDYMGEFSPVAKNDDVVTPPKTEDTKPAAKLNMDKALSGLN